MSGGSQHNPNGRQSQLGAGWSPLQLQVANLLARAPQAHMASERGVTWHTPTPPPHLYHVPAPSPPDPLQAMKGANSVFRHTATPPELFRHTPTPPDKHMIRHTPSPGDVKANPALQSADIYTHLGPSRDKLLRADELLSYARTGVDLTVGSRSNGSPTIQAPALSVRDAPTINSLIARTRPSHARVDALLERLSAAAPAPSPHTVIVHPHPRAAPTPSPPSSNEDSADSCGTAPGCKRKRKPERTIRVPVPPPPPEVPRPPTPRVSPQIVENGDTEHVIQNGPDKPPTPQPPEPHARRKTRSGSAETIDDIAAMIASTDAGRRDSAPEPDAPPEPEAPVTVDKLISVLTSPEAEVKASPTPNQEQKSPKKEEPETPPIPAAAPRRSARTSNAESANVPVESPSEAKPAEAEASEARSAEPTAASFIEVEDKLEKMFAGLEDPKSSEQTEKVKEKKPTAKARKRRKSAPTKGERERKRERERKASKRESRASTGDEAPRRKGRRVEKKKEGSVKDAYDSGSNASSSRSRGPYIQIVGPRDSPVSVSVINTAGTEEERRTTGGDEWRNGLRARGLHASTLGLRYDASTPDASWLCAFCERGPHFGGLGDLFGPYPVDVDTEEYRSLDESSKSRFASPSGAEVWFHEGCGVWAPGLLAAGARLWGLAEAVCGARGARCSTCALQGAAIACSHRACQAKTHFPCASSWKLMDDFRALCPRHA